MITLHITITETPQGLEISVPATNRVRHTKREALTMLALDVLLRPLLHRVANDFHRRFPPQLPNADGPERRRG